MTNKEIKPCCDKSCKNCPYVDFGGYKWLKQERWGQVHPDKPYVWYDYESVIKHNDNHLSLLSSYKPKFFEDIKRTSQMSVGLISSIDEFSYGKYDLEVKMPDLAYSWPAFWMWSWSDWPPEIDIFEGYSDSKGRYDLSWWKKLFENKFYKVESNVHIKNSDKKWNLGGIPHFFSYSDPRKNFNKFSLIWRPDLIEFYYNDTLVRRIDDKEVLKLIEGHKMNVIINNSCHSYHRSHLKNIGTMEIKNFKYVKLD